MTAGAKPAPRREGRPSMVERVRDGVYEPDPAKRTLVAMVQFLHQQGLSIRMIADGLNAAGIASTSGKRWHKRTVHAALRVDLASTQEK